MTFDGKELVNDVIRRLSLMQDLDANALDTLEMVRVPTTVWSPCYRPSRSYPEEAV